MKTAPKKILFISDKTEAELVLIRKPSKIEWKDGTYFYQYTKALPDNLNKPFPLTLAEIQNLLSLKLIEIA